MKVAKADKNDIKTTMDFLNLMDSFFDSRHSFFDKEEDWKDWDDDMPEKKRLLQIQKDIATETGYFIDDVDNDLILFQFIKEKFSECEFNWRRVVWAADILINNFCDPNKDHLAIHPIYDEGMEDYIMGK